MDIDLLAKMVKEVVMDHDTVTLPGVGCFVTEMVPAVFADRGYTIMPPYRRLYFSPKQGDDTLLIDFYAKANGISKADAGRILTDFLTEMKEVLKVRKTIVFPGLGRLRATRENHFFFVADEDLDIYPAGFGLQPISLKTHEETKEEVAEAVASLAEILEPEPAPLVELEPTPEPGSDAIVPENGTLDAKMAENDATVPESGTIVAPEPESEPVPDPESAGGVPEIGTLPAKTAENAGSVPENGTLPAVEPQIEPTVELKPVPEPVPVSEPAPEPKPKKHWWRAVWITLLVIVGIALLAVIALAVIGRVAPEWLDGLLYSQQDLDIIYNK